MKVFLLFFIFLYIYMHFFCLLCTKMSKKQTKISSMNRKLQVTALLALAATCSYAQKPTTDTEKDMKQDNSSFTFTESQLGEDDDMTQNVIMVNSNTNLYTSNVGYLWSPVRFKFRAYASQYNDIYMNGVQVNNLENGQFNYSTVGGMNDATRNQDASSPFEANAFGMASIAGSNNYDFRASHFATGHKVTLSALNRNYTARAMYTYGTGLSKNGWAFFGTVGYRYEHGSRGGYFLQQPRIFPSTAEGLQRTPFAEPIYLGQPH